MPFPPPLDPADLAVHPCQGLCAWRPTPARSPGGRLFACSGCGSQWVAGCGWTPVDRDGTVPVEVQAELGI